MEDGKWKSALVRPRGRSGALYHLPSTIYHPPERQRRGRALRLGLWRGRECRQRGFLVVGSLRSVGTRRGGRSAAISARRARTSSTKDRRRDSIPSDGPQMCLVNWKSIGCFFGTGLPGACESTWDANFRAIDRRVGVGVSRPLAGKCSLHSTCGDSRDTDSKRPLTSEGRVSRAGAGTWGNRSRGRRELHVPRRC
jgi:hypothetical protein